MGALREIGRQRVAKKDIDQITALGARFLASAEDETVTTAGAAIRLPTWALFSVAKIVTDGVRGLTRAMSIAGGAAPAPPTAEPESGARRATDSGVGSNSAVPAGVAPRRERSHPVRLPAVAASPPQSPVRAAGLLVQPLLIPPGPADLAGGSSAAHAVIPLSPGAVSGAASSAAEEDNGADGSYTGVISPVETASLVDWAAGYKGLGGRARLSTGSAVVAAKAPPPTAAAEEVDDGAMTPRGVSVVAEAAAGGPPTPADATASPVAVAAAAEWAAVHKGFGGRARVDGGRDSPPPPEDAAKGRPRRPSGGPSAAAGVTPPQPGYFVPGESDTGGGGGDAGGPFSPPAVAPVTVWAAINKGFGGRARVDGTVGSDAGSVPQSPAADAPAAAAPAAADGRGSFERAPPAPIIPILRRQSSGGVVGGAGSAAAARPRTSVGSVSFADDVSPPPAARHSSSQPPTGRGATAQDSSFDPRHRPAPQDGSDGSAAPRRSSAASVGGGGSGAKKKPDAAASVGPRQRAWRSRFASACGDPSIDSDSSDSESDSEDGSGEGSPKGSADGSVVSAAKAAADPFGHGAARKRLERDMKRVAELLEGLLGEYKLQYFYWRAPHALRFAFSSSFLCLVSVCSSVALSRWRVSTAVRFLHPCNLYSYLYLSHARTRRDVFELVRKLALTCVLSLVAPGTVLQACVGTMLAFAFVLIYALCKPYVAAGANFVTLLFQVDLFLFFFVGLLLKCAALPLASTCMRARPRKLPCETPRPI